MDVITGRLAEGFITDERHSIREHTGEFGRRRDRVEWQPAEEHQAAVLPDPFQQRPTDEPQPYQLRNQRWSDEQADSEQLQAELVFVGLRDHAAKAAPKPISEDLAGILVEHFVEEHDVVVLGARQDPVCDRMSTRFGVLGRKEGLVGTSLHPPGPQLGIERQDA